MLPSLFFLQNTELRMWGEQSGQLYRFVNKDIVIVIIIMCLQAFIQRVEQRKLLLDLAVSFYTHTKEVSHKHMHACMHMHT